MDDNTALEGQVAIITGAGSGVGQASALALSDAGVAITLVGRERDKLAATAKQIEQRGGDTLVEPADVANESAVQSVIDATLQRFGQIDILIAAAGIGRYGHVAGYRLDDWQATLATNLTGVFLCSRAVLAPMRQQGSGKIIAIGSGAAVQGYANLAAYAASKFGLRGYMQSLAAEAGPEGIKVSTILPGSILTDFAGRTAADKRAAMAEDPGKTYLQPEDIAAAVLFLLRQPNRAWTQELNLWPL